MKATAFLLAMLLPAVVPAQQKPTTGYALSVAAKDFTISAARFVPTAGTAGINPAAR